MYVVQYRVAPKQGSQVRDVCKESLRYRQDSPLLIRKQDNASQEFGRDLLTFRIASTELKASLSPPYLRTPGASASLACTRAPTRMTASARE